MDMPPGARRWLWTLDVMGIVTATEVDAKLSEWQSGTVTAAEVHQWAVPRYATHKWEPESDSVNEVLAALDMLDVNLTTIEDVPALKKALRSESAADILKVHFQTIDFAIRNRQLAADPLYARFCRHDV